MFLIFTLKRPDILPIGDLGVQKGLGKWILAAFDRREVDAPLSSPSKSNPVQDTGEEIVEPAKPSSTLPLPSPTPVLPKIPPLVVEPGSSKKTEPKGLSSGLLAYDPHTHGDPAERYVWPPGMDVGTLRSRLAGKKAK
jgi:DNA-3-methyladenine glycosylase II